jgi:pentose-5-phosphate-3-epimerase
MIILPSLLEYSTAKLHERILSLQKMDKYEMHLDVVSKYFAQDRGIMKSLDEKTILENLGYLKKQNLYLTIHLMGNTEDLVNSFHFFQNYQFEPNWEYKIFLPVNTELAFKTFENQSNVSIGCWFDRDQWSTSTDLSVLSVRDVLLMTVKAGKSGQELTQKSKFEAFQLAEKFPNIQFIFDGGWNSQFKTDLENVDLVSYTSFWKRVTEKFNR